MDHPLFPYALGVLSNLFFGTASMVFSSFARSVSPTWINHLKAFVAAICFGIACFAWETWANLPWTSAVSFLISGLVGLCLGDFFLFRSFTILGPSRTLMLLCVQPLFIGAYNALFFGQHLNSAQLIAIACMLVCVFIFVLERSKTVGRWDLRAFGIAFMGVLLDACGVMLTRNGFDTGAGTGVGAFQANFLRCLGALAGFLILNPRSFTALKVGFIGLTPRKRTLAVFACFFGTFVSLTMYLNAIKLANVAVLTSITVTGPVWVSLIEHILERKLPSRYLIGAMTLFLVGFFFIRQGMIQAS